MPPLHSFHPSAQRHALALLPFYALTLHSLLLSAQMAIASEAAEEEAIAAKAAQAVKKKAGGIAGAARARHAAAVAAAAGAATPAVHRTSTVGSMNIKSPAWGLYTRIVELFRDRYAALLGLTSDSVVGDDSSIVDTAWAPVQQRLETLAIAGMCVTSKLM